MTELQAPADPTPLNMGTEVRPKRAKGVNPIASAVDAWLRSVPRTAPLAQALSEHYLADLLAQVPKRWVVYEPMVLLPSGSFLSPHWERILGRCQQDELDDLWQGILRETAGKGAKSALTHLAINEGIPLHVRPRQDEGGRSPEGGMENVLRSPHGLRLLYGCFGPATLEDGGDAPSGGDFQRAFWVSTKQNGIYQTWAPRWTMFSRGNIKEKARLLDFQNSPVVSLSRRSTWAVDMFAGIGYFVFSYAKLGMRVLCWELNPWSVEGLRRGAARNGWSVQVIAGEELARPTPEVMGPHHITVFVEDNCEATRRVQELRSAGVDLDVAHVNCGILPSSKDVWRPAFDIVGASEDAWLHLHENVATGDVQHLRGHMQTAFVNFVNDEAAGRSAEVGHVERVKTFAPDVWHCVFDVHISKDNG